MSARSLWSERSVRATLYLVLATTLCVPAQAQTLDLLNGIDLDLIEPEPSGEPVLLIGDIRLLDFANLPHDVEYPYIAHEGFTTCDATAYVCTLGEGLALQCQLDEFQLTTDDLLFEGASPMMFVQKEIQVPLLLPFYLVLYLINLDDLCWPGWAYTKSSEQPSFIVDAGQIRPLTEADLENFAAMSAGGQGELLEAHSGNNHIRLMGRP